MVGILEWRVLGWDGGRSAAKLPSKEHLCINCVAFCLLNGAGKVGER